MNKQTGLVHNMPAPTGRPPRFKTPKELWDKFVEYCDWIDGNPWQEKTASNVLDTTGAGEDQKRCVRMWLLRSVPTRSTDFAPLLASIISGAISARTISKR